MQEQSYMPTLIRLGKSFSWLIVNHICFSWFERKPQDSRIEMSINYLRLNGSEVKWCEGKKFSNNAVQTFIELLSIEVTHVQHSVSIIRMSGCQHLGSRIVDFTDS